MNHLFRVQLARVLMSIAVVGALLAVNVRAAGEDGDCDFFCYLGQANKASIVMLDEQGLVSASHVSDIARGILQIIEEQAAEGSERSSNYLDFEARLLEISGPDASRLHMGRSRQDLHGTVRRMLLRDAVLESHDSLVGARRALVELAARHGGVPFREGHHYASELTRYGRANGKRPTELTEEELVRIYRESVGGDLPIDVELVMNAMDPEAMVRSRRGLGGPQPDEVARMLEAHANSVGGSEAWLDNARALLNDADESLETEFRALLPEAGAL